MPRHLSPEAHAAILAATAELLDAGGVDAVTVDAVARRAGVARTTVYRHFGGLDGLIVAGAATSAIARVTGEDGPDTGSLRGDLLEIQRRYLEIVTSPVNRSVFVWMVTRAMHDPEAAAWFRAVRNQPRGPTVVALQRAIARGEIPPTVDLEMALHLIQGPMISKRIIDGTEVIDDDLETMVDLVIDGLAGRHQR